VVFITAPAGYGKSTLMAQWSEVDDRPFGWIAIDDADNDPVVFLISLALALDGIETIDDALMYALVAADGEWTTQLVTGITDVILRREVPFVLVLENLHVLDGPSRDVLLPALAAHVPPGSTLALVTRTRLPMPTSRATLGGHAHTLDACDLAMTDTEASTLLAGSGLDLDAELVDVLTERTEG
jgi:LuxR family maltose regulon positive regulatory protein